MAVYELFDAKGDAQSHLLALYELFDAKLWHTAPLWCSKLELIPTSENTSNLFDLLIIPLLLQDFIIRISYSRTIQNSLSSTNPASGVASLLVGISLQKVSGSFWKQKYHLGWFLRRNSRLRTISCWQSTPQKVDLSKIMRWLWSGPWTWRHTHWYFLESEIEMNIDVCVVQLQHVCYYFFLATLVALHSTLLSQ